MALESARGPGQHGPVLVRCYLELGCPAHEVEAVLTQDPQGWLPELVEATSRWGTELVSRVGLSVGGHRLDREVNVTVFALHRLGDTSVIPLAWHHSVESSMLPSLEGDIELSPLGDDRAQLAISASYRPPLGWLGAVSDRALMRRVAEATIKDFLERVAVRLEANLAQAEAGPTISTAVSGLSARRHRAYHRQVTSQSELPGRFRNRAGMILTYRVDGNGPVLVCHTGGPGFSSAYLQDLGGLSQTRTLVLLDPRGTGASERPQDAAGEAPPNCLVGTASPARHGARLAS